MNLPAGFLRTAARYRIVALVPIFLTCLTTVHAQRYQARDEVDTGGLTVEYEVGWDGVVTATSPVPVSFLISNWSGRDIDGQLTLSDPVSGQEVRLGDVFVSRESERSVTTIQAIADWSECFATLTDGYEVVWRRELPLIGRGVTIDRAFVLCVDVEGRPAPLPETVSPRSDETEESEESEESAAEDAVTGRKVGSLGAPPWQMPRHPGPFSFLQAIIFSENATAELLNVVQWQAVADWMCQGGTVYVHGDSQSVIDQLLRSAPLGAEPAVFSGLLAERRAGLGVLVTYSHPLFASGQEEVARQIAESISQRRQHHAASLFASMWQHHTRSGRAESNRAKILAFFAGYMFFSGVVTMCLFRLSRRRIAIWTITVVLAASVLSGLLGGLLRVSEGDLNWMSATQVGAGGAVQVGRITVQSSGGRNTQVGAKGSRIDLQCITDRQAHDRYRYAQGYDNGLQPGWHPFTWQASLVPNEPDLYRVKTPMTPWGTRLLHATTFVPEIQRLECRLEYHPSDESIKLEEDEYRDWRAIRDTALCTGEVELTLKSDLPFDVMDCYLVIGTTLPIPEDSPVSIDMIRERFQYHGFEPVGSNQNEGVIEVYDVHQLGSFASGRKLERSYKASLKLKDYWELQNNWHDGLAGGSFSFPRLSGSGTRAAWIVGRIEESPGLSIDRAWSDFTVLDEVHLFVQQLRPEEIHGLDNLNLQVEP